MGKVVNYLRKNKKAIIASILLLISLILLSSFVYYMEIEDGTYKEDDWENTPYVVSTYTNSAQIGSNGITTEKTKDEIWNDLIAEGSNIEKYLNSSDELQKLINAELITKYPKIDVESEDAINGIIEFQRNKTDGTSTTLKYMDKETFESNVDSKTVTLSDGTSMLDYFTLDDSGNIEIVVINKETYKIESNDSNLSISSLVNEGIDVGNIGEENRTNNDRYYPVTYNNIEYNIMKKTINYKSAVQKYTMPFQYLWSLLVIGEDKDFVLELADLVEESEIIISIYDNITTTEYNDVYSYTQESQIDKNIKVRINNGYENTWQESETSISSNNTNDYFVNITRKYENNSFVFDLTKADVWIMDYSKEYSYRDAGTSTEINSKDLEDIKDSITTISSDIETSLLGDSDAQNFANSQKDTYIENYKSTLTGIKRAELENEHYRQITASVSYVKYDIDTSKINRTKETTTITTGQHYVEGNVVSEPKVEKNPSDGKENFVSLLCKSTHKDARNKICSEVTDWLIEILENNPDTVNMVDLTKYLLYKVTGNDYGITDYDFSIFSDVNFNIIGATGTDQLIRYIHKWENASGPPTNADGTMYIVEDDGYGHPTVGYGVDIENSGYKSLFIEAGYSTNIGDAIPIEFVDEIETMEMEEKVSKVKSKTSGLELTDYQINALISRAYNCGTSGALDERNGKTFVEAYTAYWNQETDDQFEEKDSNANFNHSLYTQYMNKPNTSNGAYSRGLENRRKSEWTLFQTGYYDKLDEWHSGMGDSIVGTAKIIHEYMEQNSYSYCVYGVNSYEECGKSTANGSKHGLNRTFEESKTGYKHSCCATYVSWVLQECGYLSDSEHTNSANTLQSLLTSKGWIRISSVSELQPGDILCYNNHVEIYAGDNKIYNAGSGNSIRNSSPSNRSRTFSYALRAPN